MLNPPESAGLPNGLKGPARLGYCLISTDGSRPSSADSSLTPNLRYITT